MNTRAYETRPDDDAIGIRYLFESDGITRITKAIEYSRIGELDGRIVYNLGFGDYIYDEKKEKGKILDDTNSNNGDMREVFSTVLNTIPIFFNKNGNTAIFVQGSDRKRTRIYRGYVNKNFVELIKEYTFYGIIDGEYREEYKCGKEYTGIIVYRKSK